MKIETFNEGAKLSLVLTVFVENKLQRPPGNEWLIRLEKTFWEKKLWYATIQRPAKCEQRRWSRYFGWKIVTLNRLVSLPSPISLDVFVWEINCTYSRSMMWQRLTTTRSISICFPAFLLAAHLATFWVVPTCLIWPCLSTWSLCAVSWPFNPR